MPKLTNRLLKRACRIAVEASKVQGELTEAFNERYGCTYSDVDADPLIDSLDYGGSVVTVDDCDQIMTDAGCPPLSSRDQGGQP